VNYWVLQLNMTFFWKGNSRGDPCCGIYIINIYKRSGKIFTACKTETEGQGPSKEI
jgi:hypothetical protein